MNETASADLWRLLAWAGSESAIDYPDAFSALGLQMPGASSDRRAVHTEAFVAQCVPYASIYIGSQGAIGGEAADRIAGFRRLLGVDAVDGAGQILAQAPDHLPDLLSDYAELTAMVDDPQARHARTAMLWEHLLCWSMPFCDALARSAPAPYDGWATTLREAFVAEAEAAGLPSQLPLHLRQAPVWNIGTQCETIDDMARAVFVPAATGLVLTRADLERAAGAIDGGTVYGSRVFMLQTLLSQDSERMLSWLAAEAGRQASSRRREIAVLGDVAQFWALRAQASAQAFTAAQAEGALVRGAVDG